MLTPRQIEIMYWLSKDKDRGAIQKILGKSRSLVDLEINACKERFDVETITGAVSCALRAGIIK